MSAFKIPFPLAYVRQYAEPIDPDLVFATTSERTAYLSNPRRYGGMVVGDLEAAGVYMLNAARNAWITAGGGGSTPKSIKTITFADSPYSVLAGDGTILVDTAGGDVDITYPVGIDTDARDFQKITTNANTITVTPSSGTIAGEPELIISLQYESVRVQSNLTNLFIL